MSWPGSDPGARPATGPRVLLGVAGGIAAYKACELLRLFTESGARVRVLPTAAALRFVGAPTWAALSGEPVTTDPFDAADQVAHVQLARDADLLVVAPATADLIARAATGRADDLLTAALLTARCPVLLAPAMHTEMWQHPATAANVATLRGRGVLVADPAVGRLTGLDSGPGRLPEPVELFALAQALLQADPATRPDLTGRRVVVSAGGTREELDPVRFLGNRSSGRQGYALARTAVAFGAEVTVVAANVTLPDPAGAKVVPVGSAEELRLAVHSAAQDADVVVMAAAVADFRPAARSGVKIKKTDRDPAPLPLVRTPDVLAELAAARRPGQLLVGFAAETEDALAAGRAKLAAKGADLLVVNLVGEGRGFDAAENAGTILAADGCTVDVPLGPKEALATAVWRAVAARLPAPA
jgi:phosphopantothenoylcysteine decarboxylase/phosphopantothenate--cysteine ligase